MALIQVSPSERVTEEIEGWLATGALSAGATLPSERIMCDRFKTNRTTLRSALQRVKSAGLIGSAGGSYWVSDPRFMRDMHDLRSFAELVAEAGSELTSEPIGPALVAADESIAEQLQIPEGAPIFRLIRVRSVDGLPINVEWTHLSAAKFPDFDRIDFSIHTLYETLETSYGVIVESGSESFGICFASKEQASLLEIDVDTPLFEIEGCTFSPEGEPLEAFYSVLLPDRVGFATTVTREGAGEGEDGNGR